MIAGADTGESVLPAPRGSAEKARGRDGFSGGEQVQLTGAIRPEMTQPGIGGTWYQVDTIRLWSSTKPQ